MFQVPSHDVEVVLRVVDNEDDSDEVVLVVEHQNGEDAGIPDGGEAEINNQ